MSYAVTIVAVYFLPTLIAFARGHRNRRALATFNLFGGWTIFGWLAALTWSIYHEPSSYPRCEFNARWNMTTK